VTSRLGAFILALVVIVAALAPWIAPNPPEQRFANFLYAPPTRIYVYQGGLHAPYVYESRVVNRLAREFRESRVRPVPLRWFSNGHLVTAEPQNGVPLLLLGADAYGRDVFSRLVHAARISLSLALVATVLALAIGASIGAAAGYAGGRLDDVLSRVTEFVLVLPVIYVALALRAVMPLVLPPSTVFVSLTAIFALFGWPIVARGVRGIVTSERQRDYTLAARAIGAGPIRILRHLLPATRGYLTVQGGLLVPAFILAEATMSYVGLGFPDSTPTWGTMLQQAANVSLIADSPWMLAPAAAIFVVVLGINLLVDRSNWKTTASGYTSVPSRARRPC
jgi:peptide/nickel transport system permease protein